MRTNWVAAVLYFLVVFAAGFAMGLLRVTTLAPRLGPSLATVLELPVMLAVSWFACLVIVRWLRVPARIVPRVAMGGIAFLLLLVADVVLAVAGFGRTIVDAVLDFATLPGALGLAGQIAFALFPVVQLFWPRRADG